MFWNQLHFLVAPNCLQGRNYGRGHVWEILFQQPCLCLFSHVLVGQKLCLLHLPVYWRHLNEPQTLHYGRSKHPELEIPARLGLHEEGDVFCRKGRLWNPTLHRWLQHGLCAAETAGRELLCDVWRDDVRAASKSVRLLQQHLHLHLDGRASRLNPVLWNVWIMHSLPSDPAGSGSTSQCRVGTEDVSEQE